MANPLIAGVGIGANVLGSIFSGIGAERAGQAQQMTDQFMAQQALYNSQVAKRNAAYASEAGELQAGKYGLGAAARMGQIKASQASSGLDVNSGSALQVQKSQQLVTGIDLDQIRSNAAKTAYNYNVEAVQDKNQAQLYTMAGSNAAAAGQLGMETSLISGAGSVASKWLAASKGGMFNGFGDQATGFINNLGL